MLDILFLYAPTDSFGTYYYDSYGRKKYTYSTTYSPTHSSTSPSLPSRDLYGLFETVFNTPEKKVDLVKKIVDYLARITTGSTVNRDDIITEVCSIVKSASLTEQERKEIEELNADIKRLTIEVESEKTTIDRTEKDMSFVKADQERTKVLEQQLRTAREAYDTKKKQLDEKKEQQQKKNEVFGNSSSSSPFSKLQEEFSKELRRRADEQPPVVSIIDFLRTQTGDVPQERIELKPSTTTSSSNKLEYDPALVRTWLVQQLASNIGNLSGPRQTFVTNAKSKLTTLLGQLTSTPQNDQATSLGNQISQRIDSLLKSDFTLKDPSHIAYAIQALFKYLISDEALKKQLEDAIKTKPDDPLALSTSMQGGSNTKPAYKVIVSDEQKKKEEEDKKKKEAEDAKKKDAEDKGEQKNMLAEISKVTEPFGLNFAELIN